MGTTNEHAKLTGAEPQLFVADVRRAADFYVSKLGFAVAFFWGEPPYYAQVHRDGVRLNLRCVERPVMDATLRHREELLSASITVASRRDMEALDAELAAAGVTLHQSLQAKPWGALDLIIEDPDGNLILFSGPGG